LPWPPFGYLIELSELLERLLSFDDIDFLAFYWSCWLCEPVRMFKIYASAL